MAVVINDFEVLPAAPAAPVAKAAEGKDDASKDKLDSAALSAALHCMDVHSLRSWAH
jgi:hypothetical protein